MWCARQLPLSGAIGAHHHQVGSVAGRSIGQPYIRDPAAVGRPLGVNLRPSTSGELDPVTGIYVHLPDMVLAFPSHENDPLSPRSYLRRGVTHRRGADETQVA